MKQFQHLLKKVRFSIYLFFTYIGLFNLYPELVQAKVAHQAVSFWAPNSTIRFDDRFSVYLELQFRAADFAKQWLQFQARTALNYHLNSNVMFSLGYVFTETWPYGEFPAATKFPEHRLWEQAQITHTMDRVVFQHRGRLEQRFIANMKKK